LFIIHLVNLNFSSNLPEDAHIDISIYVLIVKPDAPKQVYTSLDFHSSSKHKLTQAQ